MTDQLTHEEQRMDRLRKLVSSIQEGNKYRKPLSGGGLISVSFEDLRWLLQRHDELLDLVIKQADADAAEHHPEA